MSGLNKVMLIGRLGKDPEIKQAVNVGAIANISLATSENWKNKETGEKQEKTEWHRLVFFGKKAEIAAQYLRKGSQIYVEGKISYGKFTGKDGTVKHTTDIVVDDFKMLDGKKNTDQAETVTANISNEFNDDIPF